MMHSSISRQYINSIRAHDYYSAFSVQEDKLDRVKLIVQSIREEYPHFESMIERIVALM
jgi:hypothetical protein